MHLLSTDDLPKPGSAQKISQLPGGPAVPEKVTVCPYPSTNLQELESYKSISNPNFILKPNGILRQISAERTEGFDATKQCIYFFRRNIFLAYLVMSMLIAISAVGLSILLDLSILQYLGLIRGQLHTIFIIVFAHCVFLLLISSLGCFSAYRRGYRTLILYIILSATLLMLVVMCIFYAMAMRHEVKIHLYNSMFHGVHTYAEAPDKEINLYWDNVQKQFSCCGLYGPSDWKLDVYLNVSLPDSCCKEVTEGCGKGQLSHPDPEHFHIQGCYQPFFDWLDLFTYEMIGIACLLVAWQIVGLGISWNLSRITRQIAHDKRVGMKLWCC